MSTTEVTRRTMTHTHQRYAGGCDDCTMNRSWIWVVINHPTPTQREAADVAYRARDQHTLDAIREQIEEARA
jgi:hypothetical protein